MFTMLRNGRYVFMEGFPTTIVAGILLFLFAFSSPAFAKKKDDIFLAAEISNTSPYQGEAVVLTYKLYSKNGDIKFARRTGETVLDGGKEFYFSKIETDSRGRRERVEGEEYYVFPLESYVLSVDKKGNYTYKGGSFNVGVNYPVVYEDPFWGRRRGYRTETKELQIPSVSFKVKQLPSSPNGFRDVNAVGEFTITTSVPPGDIILEQPARAIITLKGHGLLGEDILPQYADAFSGEDVRLKSMSESRNVYFDGKNIVTELSLDCEFIPLDKDVEIGSVGFKYFNPVNGKFEEKLSLPVKVKVRSITSKMQTTDV
ncbi:MAG: hypothetical protein K2M39_09785 [Muribaculaceae bacterium]|nr:hypothetical protein [Muribaculaceae bacterium]